MIRRVLILGSIILMICLLGCGEDEMPMTVLGKYESGVFVINQGKFGDGTGTVTYYDRDTTIIQNIYQTENAGFVLGNIAQSMQVANGNTYLAINNAAKIEVVDVNDFTRTTTIDGLAQVRYMITDEEENRLFASSWGTDGVSGVLYEINTETNLIESQLETGGGLENMVIDGTELYVTKSGGFGTDSTLIQYDLSRSVIEEEYIVGDNPVGIVKDNEDDIWVLCSGAFDFSNPTNNTAGGLYLIEGDNAILQLELLNGSNNLVIDEVGNNLYYLDSEGIKVVDLTTLESSLFASGFYYALGFDPKDRMLYASDAKDFSSNGEALIFDRSGVEQNRIETGIIPGGFYFAN